MRQKNLIRRIQTKNIHHKCVMILVVVINSTIFHRSVEVPNVNQKEQLKRQHEQKKYWQLTFYEFVHGTDSEGNLTISIDLRFYSLIYTYLSMLRFQRHTVSVLCVCVRVMKHETVERESSTIWRQRRLVIDEHFWNYLLKIFTFINA